MLASISEVVMRTRPERAVLRVDRACKDADFVFNPRG